MPATCAAKCVVAYPSKVEPKNKAEKHSVSRPPFGFDVGPNEVAQHHFFNIGPWRKQTQGPFFSTTHLPTMRRNHLPNLRINRKRHKHIGHIR